jgi:hypothetical protein
MTEEKQSESYLTIAYNAIRKVASVGLALIAGCSGTVNLEEQAATPVKPFDSQKAVYELAKGLSSRPGTNYPTLGQAFDFIHARADANNDKEVTRGELSDFLRTNPWVVSK